MLDVSVVIVSFNTVSLLADCLSSLYPAASLRHEATGALGSGGFSRACPDAPAEACTPYEEPAGENDRGQTLAAPREVIVVDNGSSDGSREMVAARFPQVRLIANDENRGFAAANNQALRLAAGRYILLLNSDTLIPGDAIAKLAGFLEANPQAAVAGAQLQNPDGTHQHSAFRFPGLLMTFFDFFPINHRLANSRLNGRYPRRSGGPAFEIDHPLGACMMIRREAIDRVGMLDEQFFMYCEEIDWCLRMKRDGWRLYCLPEVRVVHYGGGSTRQIRSAMYAELFKSRARLFRKHRSPLFCLAVRSIVKLGLWQESRRARRRFRAGRLGADGLGLEMEALRRARLALDDHA